MSPGGGAGNIRGFGCDPKYSKSIKTGTGSKIVYLPCMTLLYIPCNPGGFKGEEGVAGRDRGVGNS